MIRTFDLPKIIFLQGPPGCGKDTIASLLHELGGYMPHKFAQPIIDAMYGMFPKFFNPGNGLPSRSIEDFKKHNFAPFLNQFNKGEAPDIVTGRDIMIAWSEKFMKPLFGDKVFGTLADIKVFPRDEDLITIPSYRICFSDSGFESESVPLLASCPHNLCAIIQVYRPGHNYSSDSRSYWSDPRIASFSYNNALEGLDAFQKDFIKFFNSSVYSYDDQLKTRSA